MTDKQQRTKAHVMVNRAVKSGKLIKPSNCELCGEAGKPHKRQDARHITNIVGHHYNGHDNKNALNVWWVCQSCNTKLKGIHDGSLTKEEAQQFVLEYEYTKAYKYNLKHKGNAGRPDYKPRTERQVAIKSKKGGGFRPWDYKYLVRIAASKKDKTTT